MSAGRTSDCDDVDSPRSLLLGGDILLESRIPPLHKSSSLRLLPSLVLACFVSLSLFVCIMCSRERVEILKRIQIRRKLRKKKTEEEEKRKEEGLSLSFAKNVVVRLTLILINIFGI